LGRAVHSGELDGFVRSLRQSPSPAYPASSKAIVFLENHDLQRTDAASGLLSYRREPSLARLGYVFMLAWPYGYPSVLSSYDYRSNDDGPPVAGSGLTTFVFDRRGDCRAPWLCEHRDPVIVAMVKFRNAAADFFAVSNLWSNGHDQLAFGRGPYGFVVMNLSSGALARDFHVSLAPGVYRDALEPESSVYVVDRDHVVHVEVGPLSAVVLVKDGK
jgi:alpha-amylase